MAIGALVGSFPVAIQTYRICKGIGRLDKPHKTVAADCILSDLIVVWSVDAQGTVQVDIRPGSSYLSLATRLAIHGFSGLVAHPAGG